MVKAVIDKEATEMAMAAVLAIVLPMVIIEKMHKINENCTGKGDANVIVKHFLLNQGVLCLEKDV